MRQNVYRVLIFASSVASILNNMQRVILKDTLLAMELFFCFIYLSFFRLKYYETSAATGHNVAKAVEGLLDLVLLRMEQTADKTKFPFRNGQKINVVYKLEESSSSKGGKCGC